MNEIQRLAYLDALGIDSYISRSQLPAAAPSRRLRVVRTVEAAAAASQAAQQLLPAVPQPESALDSENQRPTTGAVQPDAAPPTDNDATPMFSVAACFLAGHCWLDEIPRARELGDNYLQLLQGICYALGWDARAPVLERFDWPMHHNRQLDQGQATARHGFEGFIRARMERYPVRGVILLGDTEAGWLDPEVFSGLELLTTVSAWRMLKQPELKVEAWRDLKRLSRAQD